MRATATALCIILAACETTKPIPPYTRLPEQQSNQEPTKDSNYFTDAPWYFWVGLATVAAVIGYGFSRVEKRNESHGMRTCFPVPMGYPGAKCTTVVSSMNQGGQPMCCL